MTNYERAVELLRWRTDKPFTVISHEGQIKRTVAALDAAEERGRAKGRAESAGSEREMSDIREQLAAALVQRGYVGSVARELTEWLAPVVERLRDEAAFLRFCDRDPIECNYEAALGEAEEKLRRVLALADELDAIFGGHDADYKHGEGYCVGLASVADRIRTALDPS